MPWDEADRQLDRRVSNLEDAVTDLSRRHERQARRLDVHLDARLPEEGRAGGGVNWRTVGAFAGAILAAVGGPMAVAYLLAGGHP